MSSNDNTPTPEMLQERARDLEATATQLREHAEWIAGHEQEETASHDEYTIDAGELGHCTVSVEIPYTVDMAQIHRDSAPADTDTDSDFERIASVLDATALDLSAAADALEQMQPTPAALDLLDLLDAAAHRIRAELPGLSFSNATAELLDQLVAIERQYPGLGTWHQIPAPVEQPTRQPWPGSDGAHRYELETFAAEYDPPTGLTYTGTFGPWEAGVPFLNSNGRVEMGRARGSDYDPRHHLKATGADGLAIIRAADHDGAQAVPAASSSTTTAAPEAPTFEPPATVTLT